MSRSDLLAKLNRPASDPWDIAVIGGGAVGLGTALDAASRGYSVVVFEQSDFGKGTSSRSTKLIHGGVRYLAQGNVGLVREALHERELLLRNAPALVKPLRFIVPCYSLWERAYYWAGMKCYDALAGRLGIGSSRCLSTRSVTRALPGIRAEKLRGGVAYYDAQFDDARLVVVLATSVLEQGGLPLNFMRAVEMIKSGDKVAGILVEDLETSITYEVYAKAVINAAGVFSDQVRKMERSDVPDMISPSQGIHLVVDKRFLGCDDALMIPSTQDGRVLFAIPWLGRVILGTTDTPVAKASVEPRPLQQEVDYLLDHFAAYLDPSPERDDVLSAFAGLRPLVKPNHEVGATSKISREHRIVESAGGLLSILGGKWTTFRKMAEDAVDAAEQVAGLGHAASITSSLQLTDIQRDGEQPCSEPSVEQIMRAVDKEFARTVEDVLARRTRCLLLDAKKSAQFAPRVANLLGETLGRTTEWVEEQIREYEQLTKRYSL